MADVIITFGERFWYPIFEYVDNILMESEIFKITRTPLSDLDIYHELLPYGITYHVGSRYTYTLDDEILSFILLGSKL